MNSPHSGETWGGTGGGLVAVATWNKAAKSFVKLGQGNLAVAIGKTINTGIDANTYRHI